MSVIPPKDGKLGDWWKAPPETVAQNDKAAVRNAKEIEDLRRYQEAALKREELKAQRANGAGIPRAFVDPKDIVLDIAMDNSRTTELHYLVDPYLPCKQVVGFYGRGGTAKSSLLATLAAQVSENASTLWVSTEEINEWITVRHIKAGGDEGTLLAVKAVVTAKDEDGRAISTDFNIYSHLEPAIKQAASIAAQMYSSPRPLRLVVLDTAVALTTWGKGESANDDGGVKRLMSFLKGLAEKYDVTIAVIGHSNKGRHQQLTDMVAGSSAWTNSPRQAFIHLRDERGINQFVIVAVKHSLTGAFAASYETEPVHELSKRADGNHSVLCRVDLLPPQWGYDAVEALVDAALERDKEKEDDWRMSSKEEGVAQIVATVKQLLAEGHAKVDRGMVTERIGSAPNKRHWIPADVALVAGGDVLTTRGGHGIIFYELKK